VGNIAAGILDERIMQILPGNEMIRVLFFAEVLQIQTEENFPDPNAGTEERQLNQTKYPTPPLCEKIQKHRLPP
jgi:hypothetical protein